ncbi:MAG: tyrosine-type recombinase/integrase [bacterium]|nr:tyrosine-type recombinase/integrase [Acidimicrobiaceae bacterium]MCY3633419.1 tyrosine-type recombinase/integrase [bacterium]
MPPSDASPTFKEPPTKARGSARGSQGIAFRGGSHEAAVGDPPAVEHTHGQESLTDSDLVNLDAILTHEIADNTLKNYLIQWNIFRRWAAARGVTTLPAETAQVAAYLAERMERRGHRPSTLRVAAAAIAYAHRVAGREDPCASDEVKRTLKGATRKAGTAQKQAEGLTAEALEFIISSAHRRRPGRGGRLERTETAEARGNVDIALIRVMRDAMLRISEAAALTWADIHAEADGSGRLLIRRSKTDPEGRGAVAFLSTPTMAALELVRDSRTGADSVFDLKPNQISRRIKLAARTAGLGDGFSGHSPRVGMARDLMRVGIELPALMNAGRWRSPAMPAHYARNEAASNGAVAQFYNAHDSPR